MDLVLKQILRAASENQFAVLAYCFMPDHLHLLIEGRSESSDGKQMIARSKQYSGYYFKQVYGETLWQRYGFERVLRDDEATIVVARYILENPIRRRLVDKVDDYPFLGSAEYRLSDLLDGIARSG